MMDSLSSQLAAALADGGVLLGTLTSANAANNLGAVLKSRLSSYLSRLRSDDTQSLNDNVQDLQLLTGREALSVVKRIHDILDTPIPDKPPIEEGSPSDDPALGTRDLTEIRTLLSLTFKWTVEPLLLRINELWSSPVFKNKIPVDLTVNADDSQILSGLITSLFSLIFPEGAQGRISQTLIATTLLSLHSKDILLPSISFGWLPQSQASKLVEPLHEARPLVTRFLRLLTPAQAISALTNVMASTTPLPPAHTRKACAQFLTKQLLRPNGVKGLFEAAFSSEEAGTDNVKVEQIAKMLNSVPSNMRGDEYYQAIIPQVLKILLHDEHPSYKQAAAFVIFRAIVPPHTSHIPPSASTPVLRMLHRPFFETSDEEAEPILSPHDSLWSLTVLMSNTEPSPVFISQLLSPIIVNIYAISYDMACNKLMDPQLKEYISGLLLSWGKIVDREEGSGILWSLIEKGKDCTWKFGLDGKIWRVNAQNESSPIVLPYAATQKDDEDDLDTNVFDLFPDPVHFVDFLKKLDRGDVASSIFIRLLENYRNMKGRSNEDPIKTLHKLQIIMQMQKRLSEGTTSNILRKPDLLLSFILHVLDAANSTLQVDTEQKAPVYEEDILQECDSDDEAPDSEAIGPDDELIETAITLLLSILEADETLTARIYPIFNEIFIKLETLALKGSSTLRPLAREARLVITARLANVSGSENSGLRKEDDQVDQEVYQKALKLLQDPILPVRAHGLLLLRGLVMNYATKNRKVNQALVPSILSIFLQAVQDEDSYMFLNAVQGLAALADTFGKEIIQGLIHDYAGGLDGLGAGNMTQQDLDIRLRIGEALASIIKRCGAALSLYVDILVPPLFTTLRRSNVSTALRTSSLSLLADCVDTYPLSLLPFIEDLAQTMIDLLQVESVPLSGHKSKPETGPTEGNRSDKPAKPTLDSDPTSRITKFPPLRRSAIHFLSLLIRATTKLVYDDLHINLGGILAPASVRRMSITLGYIFSTDEDSIVRAMAREAKENLQALQEAVLGL